MSEHLTIARPYASALFAEADGDEHLYSAWAKVLQVLTYIMNQPAIKNLMNDPRSTTLTQVLKDLVSQVVAKEVSLLGQKFDNLLKLLVQHKRLNVVAGIFTLFKALINQAQNITDVTVTSAYEMSDALKEQINQALVKKFQTKISIEFGIDKSLIGGAIIRTDKLVIDGSIKGKLASLHQSLESIKG